MPSFETQYEQDKWDRLSAQADTAMEKAHTDQATAEDVKIVTNILKEFGKTVDGVVKDATKDLKKEAKAKTKDTIVKRQRKGKKPYSKAGIDVLYKKYFEELLDTHATELLLAFEGVLRDELEKLGINLMYYVDGAKDEILERLDALEDNVTDILQDLIDNCCNNRNESTEGNVQAKGKESPEDLIDRLLNTELETQEKELSSEDILDAVDLALQQGLSEVHSEEDTDDFTAHLNNLLGETTATLETKSETLSDELSDINEQLENLGFKESKSNKDKEEDRKANTWIRAISRSWLGQKVGRAYDSGTSIGKGLLKAAGAVLVTSLMGGKLWDHIKDYLSVQRLKEYAMQFFDYLSEKTRQLVSYITSKIPWLDTDDDEPEPVYGSVVPQGYTPPPASTSPSSTPPATPTSGTPTSQPSATSVPATANLPTPSSTSVDPDTVDVDNPNLPVNAQSGNTQSNVTQVPPTSVSNPPTLANAQQVASQSNPASVVNPNLPPQSTTNVNSMAAQVSATNFGGNNPTLSNIVNQNLNFATRSSVGINPSISSSNVGANFAMSTNVDNTSSITHNPITNRSASVAPPPSNSIMFDSQGTGSGGGGSGVSQMPSVTTIPNVSGSPGLGMLNVGLLSGA